MAIVCNFVKNLSATYSVLTYRARRIFRMCVCGQDVELRRFYCCIHYSIISIVALIIEILKIFMH